MQNPMIRRSPRRNVDTILARQSARIQQHVQTYAPGFRHGDFSFEEIYELDMGAWFESCVFVNKLISVSGRVLAYAVAKIEDGFVTISHHIKEDASVASAWLARHTHFARTIVELETTTYNVNHQLDMNANHHVEGYIPMRCDMRRLQSLEARHLRVTRDHNTHLIHTMDEVTMTTLVENNVMSLMALCCRLLLVDAPCEDETLDA